MYPEQYNYSEPRPKPNYTKTDVIYAWLSFLFAFLLCRVLPVTEHPLGGFLLILALFATGFVILRLKKVRFRGTFAAASALVIGSALLLTETKFLINLSLTYSLGSYCYFLYTAFGNRIESGFSEYIYIDFIKMLFILPFQSCIAIFSALSNKSPEKSGRFLLKILIGVGIGLIPTVMVFAFLSYDDGFMKILANIFSSEGESTVNLVGDLIYTVAMAMYGFGLYASSQQKLMYAEMSAEKCENGLRKTKILPQLTALVAVVPIVFLYVVFFVSQWRYYVSGFTGVLPSDFSYAEYARSGFFELCAVSIINLVVIAAIAFFIRRGKRDSSVILKIVSVVFCLCTLILISTAVAKLVMYIDCYGLTQRRIYAMWLMTLIGIIFLLIALGQFLRKVKTVAVCLSVSVVMFAILAVCNVNSLCASYNADRYLDGSLNTLDVAAMEELGDSAIPSLVRVVTSMGDEGNLMLRRRIEDILGRNIAECQNEDSSIFAFSVPSAQARDALEDYIAWAEQQD